MAAGHEREIPTNDNAVPPSSSETIDAGRLVKWHVTGRRFQLHHSEIFCASARAVIRR